MLVNNTTVEPRKFNNEKYLMENQIEKFLNGFANDVIKVLENHSVPFKQ